LRRQYFYRKQRLAISVFDVVGYLHFVFFAWLMYYEIPTFVNSICVYLFLSRR
jgi:hypothetical protein